MYNTNRKFHKLVLVNGDEREPTSDTYHLEPLIMEGTVTWVMVNSQGTEMIPLSSIVRAHGGTGNPTLKPGNSEPAFKQG